MAFSPLWVECGHRKAAYLPLGRHHNHQIPEEHAPQWSRMQCIGPNLNTRVRPTRALAGARCLGMRTDRAQLTVLNRAEKTPAALSASFTLQAVRFASRLICVALRFVFSVL